MSIVSNKSGSTPIFYYSKVGATSLNVVDNSLDSLYEFPKVAPTGDGQIIAFDTDGSSSFVDTIPGNPNALITDTPLITPIQGSVIISDGLTSTGTNKSEDLIIRDYGVIDVYKQLNCNDVINIQSLTTLPCTMSSGTDDFTINNTQGSRTVFLNSNSYVFDNNIISNENVILNNAKALTLNNNFDVDNIKLYKANEVLGSFILDNQTGSKTDFRGASSYLFSNDVSIGDNTTSKKLYLNNVEIKPPVQFLNNYYVSPSGTNANGNGSISNPWGTISHAISTLSAIVGDIQATINISAGTYTENLTINKSGIALIGASSNLPNLTTINGNILFDMTNNTSFFSVGGLENIQLNGTLEHRQTNIYTNSLNVINCLFFAPSGKSAIGTIGTGGGLLGNMTIQASLIYMCDNTIAVDINNTAISMINTQLTNSPLLAVSATSFITVSGAGRINLFGCSIFQSSSVSTVDPLIVVNNNSTVTSSSTINSCILVYTSGASDAGTGNKCCVKFSGSASMNTYNLVYNYFRCVGATTGAPNNQCIQKLGTAALAIIFGSNVAGSPAHHVAPASGSYTKTALSAVI